MIQGFYSAATGAQQQMKKMDVQANNIANVNTYGYKPGRVTFRESIYSTEAGGSDGNEVSGGTNPRQTGYGCSISTVDLNMSSMNLEPTGVNGDVAIQGDGFFLVGSKTEEGTITDPTSLNLSRYGDFEFDANGYLVDGRGNIVYGFVTCNVQDPNADPPVNSNTPGLNGNATSTQLVPIRLPLAAEGAGTAGQADYSTFTLLLNLSRSSAITIPAAIQIMFTIAVPALIKPDTGMIMTVAAITIPMIPWNAIE